MLPSRLSARAPIEARAAPQPGADETSTPSARERRPRRRVHNIISPAMRVETVSGKGRGVFALRRIHEGEVIERAPVLVIPASQVEAISSTVLDHYVYDWAPDSSVLAVALGNGSLYNHCYEPNARYTKHYDEGVLEYTALRDIEPGEEIVINYNGDPHDKAAMWFDVL